MAFSKITNTQLNSRGATTLPDQPTISATALKQEFDAPAKNVVAPAVNNLIDELEAVTSAASLGAQAPTGRTGQTVQAVMNSISSAIDEKSTITITPLVTSGVKIATAVVDGFTKDLYAPQGGQGTMDYDDLTDKPQINSNALSGNKSSSDLGLAAASHTHSASDITSGLATVATSNSYNDLDNQPSIPTVTDTYSGTSSDAMSGKAVKSAIDALDGSITGSPSTSKTLSAFSQTDGKVSATFADISITKSQVSDLGTIPADLDDLSDVTLSSPTNGQVLAYDSSTSKWKNQNASGGSADAYKTIDAAGTSFVASGADTFKINAGSNVTITALSSPDKGIQISASGGGQSTGDMLMSDYDSQGDVKTAGGIESYVATAISGKQDTISSGNGISVSSNTVSVDFGTVASGTTTKPPTGKAVYDAIAALDATITGSPAASKTLTAFSEADGKVSATFADISITKSQVSDFPAIPTVTDTYSGTSSDAMSGKAVKAALQTLDGSITGTPAVSKTISSFSETDGIVSATFSDISIDASQVSGLPSVPTNLSELTGDVSISSPSDDQFLRHNGTKWVNESVTIPTVSVAGNGTASTTAVHSQQITVNSTSTDIDGTKYMESTANSASFVFTNSTHILSTSAISVYTDTWGDNPSNVAVDGSNHTCTVTFSAAASRTVRIYIR